MMKNLSKNIYSNKISKYFTISHDYSYSSRKLKTIISVLFITRGNIREYFRSTISIDLNDYLYLDENS